MLSFSVPSTHPTSSLQSYLPLLSADHSPLTHWSYFLDYASGSTYAKVSFILIEYYYNSQSVSLSRTIFLPAGSNKLEISIAVALTSCGTDDSSICSPSLPFIF